MAIKTQKELSKLTENRPGLNVNLINDLTKNSIADQTLYDHGVTDLSTFREPKVSQDFVKSSLHDVPLADKIIASFNQKVVQKSGRKASRSEPIVSILVDNDMDGFSSSALLGKYLDAVKVKHQFIFTNGKNHGIKSPSVRNKIRQDSSKYLLIPDASLSLNDMAFLSNYSIDFIVIDHHDLNHQKHDLEKQLPVVNNQWDGIPFNRQFTGVGMSYLFCKKLDELNGTDYADGLLYFVSLGQIGDVSDVSDLEIRHYMLRGFRQMADSRMVSLMTDTERLSAHELSFSAIPEVNAVCRTGSLRDKRQLMNGLVDDEPQDLVTVTYRRKSKVDHKFHQHHKDIDRYQLELKRLNRIKSRQKRAVKKSTASLKGHVRELASMVIAVDHAKSFRKTEAGLIATQLSHAYQKPAIVLTGSAKPYHYGGSARGCTQVMDNFRKFCLQTKLFDFALGHGNAFGVRISDKNLFRLLGKYKDVHIGRKPSYDVDLAYLDSVPDKQQFWDVDDKMSLFGGSVSEPSLAFIGLTVKKSDVRNWGKVLTFKSHGLKFCQFSGRAMQRRFKQAKGSTVHVDVVGTPSINRFMKWSYPQVVVSDIRLSEGISDKSEPKGMPKSLDDFVF